MVATLLEEGFEPKQVTSDEIKQEFSEGKEVQILQIAMGSENKLIIDYAQKLEIFTMKCVEYDNDFQIQLCGMDNWMAEHSA